jgi:hypothetical protein
VSKTWLAKSSARIQSSTIFTALKPTRRQLGVLRGGE